MGEFIAVSAALSLLSATGHLDFNVALASIAIWGAVSLVLSLIGKAMLASR